MTGARPVHEGEAARSRSPTLSPRQRLRQSTVKFNLVAKREMRQFLLGEIDYLPGNFMDRVTLDAIKTAYAAGVRDGLAEASHGRG